MQKREKRRKSWLGPLLIVLGMLLVAGAAALVVYNNKESHDAGAESAAILQELEKAMQDVPLQDVPQQPDYIVAEEDLTMPTVTIDGYEYIGRIAIPSISIDLPVLADWDEDRLMISPCRYTGNYKTDDMVLCAHNYDSHFGQLLSIGIGEKVIFTSVDGIVYHYIISNRVTVEPMSVEEMILNMNNTEENEGGLEDWDLTLFTCHIGGQTRCAVRCLRVEEEN